MKQAKLVDNIISISVDASEKMPRSWSNIRSISIKTPYSVSLPIYNKTPEELQQISTMAYTLRDIHDDDDGAIKNNFETQEGNKHEKRKRNLKEQEINSSKSQKSKSVCDSNLNPLVSALKKQLIQINDYDKKQVKKKNAEGID